MPERPQKLTPESILLGRELRAARTLGGVSQREIADALNVSQATVHRAEKGEQWLSRDQVKAWAGRTKAKEDVAHRLVALTEAMHGATWSGALAAEQVGHLQDVAARRETTARLSCYWEQDVVPGLLQTIEYAHAVIPLMDPTGQINHAAAEAARVDRRGLLFRDHGRFEFLLAETVLRWAPAPSVMAAQLDRLIELTALPSVEIAVLPSDRIGTPSWGSFIYREPDGDAPAYVTQELLHGGPVLTDPDVVDLYRREWTAMWSADAVLRGGAAADFIRHVQRGGGASPS